MRIAAISDVHGNLFALEAVLADIGRVDLTVNLGDLLSGALQPGETADLLMSLNLPTVRGNHERQLLEQEPAAMSPSDKHAHSALTPARRAWLESLPVSRELAPGVLAFHGGPDDDLTYLLETVTAAGVRPATEAEVVERMGSHDSWSLMLCGHTHLQRSVRLSDGALVVNPGSVGWPAYDDDSPFPHLIEAGTPHARYAIVDNSSGWWEVEFCAVEYRWDEAAAIARGNGREDVSRALMTGRV